MILLYLILILISGAVIAWITGKQMPVLSRIIALFCITVDIVSVIVIFTIPQNPNDKWLIEFTRGWIPISGIELHLAIDGLSLLLLVLTFFIGFLAVLVSWKEITHNVGFFHFNILLILAGITGVFLSMDLFLFYFFWEMMLIPMYFLIAIWGHENRVYASYKFFIFTQASGLLMFLAIIGLYFISGESTGVYTFDYLKILGTKIPPALEFLLMSGFLAAFLVKLPVVPVHNWLPDAHTEAPTAGSLILASLMLKTGAYGLIRFAIPLFPLASVKFAPAGMILGVAGILYGAKLAYAQTDLKRLVAYTSVSHMGFIVLGVYAFNELAYQGVVMQIIAHGISTGTLFIITGQLYERLHTHDLRRMGGFWENAPAMGAVGLIFAMASLGLPGMGNFIAEFLTLAGTFQADALFATLASIGLIASTIYSLRIMQKVFYGPRDPGTTFPDINFRESLILGLMIIAIFFTGLFPQQVIRTAKPAVTNSIPVFEESGIMEQNKLMRMVQQDQKNTGHNEEKQKDTK